MSLTDIQKRFDDRYKKFETLYDNTVDEIDIESKTLKKALSSQTALQIEWEKLYASVSYLNSVIEEEVDSRYGEALKAELQDSYRDVSISEAKEYAKTNKSYREARKLQNSIKGLLNEIKGVMEIINSRKYVLNNITNSVINGMENHII